MTLNYKDTLTHVFGNREPRARQLEFIEACFDALLSAKPIVIEGPTGLGKSLAMISSFMPFVLEGHRVIYTTRTISQLENFINEMRAVLKSTKFKDISVSLNIGRESTRKWVCNMDNCKDCPCYKEEKVPGTYPKFFDFQEMKRSFENGICPYKVGRFQTSKKADIVLSTYSKVLNESYRREFMGMPDEREKVILIFDEAHNFFEDVVDKPFIDIGYFEQDTVSDSPALDLYELKSSLISSFLKNTGRYVFDNLKQLIREELNKVSDLISSMRQKIKTTEREKYFKSKDLKKKEEKIELIEGTWIPEDKSKLNDIETKIEDLNEERYDLDNKVDDLTYETEELQSDINFLTDEIQQKYDEIKNVSAETSSLYDRKNSLIAEIKASGSHSLKSMIKMNINSTVADIDRAKNEKNEIYNGLKELKETRQQRTNVLNKKNKEKKWYENKIEKNQYQIINFTENIIPPINKNISNNLAKIQELKKTCKQLKTQITSLEFLLSELNERYQELQQEKDRLIKLKNTLEAIITGFFSNMPSICDSLLDPENIPFEEIDAAQLRELLGLNTDEYFKTVSVHLSEEAIDLVPDLIKKGIDFYNIIVEKLFDENISGLVIKEDLSNLFSDLVFNDIEEENNNYTDNKLSGYISEFNKLIENIITCPQDFVLETKDYNSTPCWSIYTLNPKQKIQETVDGCYSSVYLSGTLSPVDIMATMVSDDAVSCKIKSEFPVENYNCYGLIGVNTSHKEELNNKRFRSDEIHIIKTALRQVLSIPVSTGIFVSSKMVLNEIYPIIMDVCKEQKRYFFPGNDANIKGQYRNRDNYSALCRKAGFDSNERDVGTKIKLIKHCAKLQTPIPVVMVDITGGQMAEGVNYNDKEMELAVVIGIPYPDITEDMEKINLRIDRLMELTDDREIAEGVAFRYTAIRKLAQTCGRVHRSKTDKGTIVLMDERLLGYKMVGNGLKKLRESSVKTIWDIMHVQIKEKIRPITCIPNNYQNLYIPSIGRRNYVSNIEHVFKL